MNLKFSSEVLPLPDTLKSKLNPALLDPVEYRKSGLSLNHVVGCPLDCSYCVRHLFSNFEMKQPTALMSDDEAVKYLLNHKFFQANKTPLQIFNRATDPFLPSVKPHTFNVLENLDQRGLLNHILVITRYRVTKEDCFRLNQLSSLRVTLLITFSGIDNEKIEPIDSNIAAQSIKIAYDLATQYRVILYWRPIVPGLNDSPRHLARAIELSKTAHATVFTGLFYREQIRAYYQASGLPELYSETARRKIFPQHLEQNILEAFKVTPQAGALFRKTSCAVSYAHSLPDYNGHYGIRELCDICPPIQAKRCASAWSKPLPSEVKELSEYMGAKSIPRIEDHAVEIEGLDEPQRYYIQHNLGYQVHDPRYPHKFKRHGRSEIGWETIGNGDQ